MIVLNIYNCATIKKHDHSHKDCQAEFSLAIAEAMLASWSLFDDTYLNEL